MGEYVVKLPDVGEGIAEAEIVAWHVAVGDALAEDEVFAEVMTDKATVELPSPASGRIVRLAGDVGDVVAVGAALVWLEDEGSDSSVPTSTAAATPAATPVPATVPAPPPAPPPTSPASASGPASPGEVRRGGAGGALAAPAVRQRARDLGIDLASIVGSGPDGRVEHRDLDAHLLNQRPRGAAAPAPALSEDVEHVKVVGLRRNIAKRMQEAYARIPHFTYVEELDLTETERVRAALNDRWGDERQRLTLLPFLMRAVVLAVRDHPEMNARFDDEAELVDRYRAVHLGIAVQTSRGLMVPVVKHADRLDLWQSAAEVARLSEAARASTVTLEELSGSTITITSLGALGGLVSTPIINRPEVAIVGVNKLVDRPMLVDGVWVPRRMMNVSGSFDHRVIDGWDAARFVQRLKELIETPALLFL